MTEVVGGVEVFGKFIPNEVIGVVGLVVLALFVLFVIVKVVSVKHSFAQ